MSKPDLVLFKTYNGIDEANYAFEVLKQGGVICKLNNNTPNVDTFITGDTAIQEFEVKVDRSQYQLALDLLEKDAEQYLDEVSADHYMLSFTSDELNEVLAKPDEWSPFDYALAKKILREKGEEKSEEELAELKEDRQLALSVQDGPEKANSTIVFGYLFAFLSGIIGLAIGVYLVSAKKTLLDGEKIYRYENSYRNHGYVITLISLVITIFGVMSEFWMYGYY